MFGLGGSGLGGGGSKKRSAQTNHPATPARKRKRDVVLQMFKQNSRSLSPNPSSSGLQQASPPNPSSSVLQQGPSPNPSISVLQPYVPSTGGSNDLWTKAYHELPDELKQQLGMSKPESATLRSVFDAVVQAQEANMANRLKLKWGDKEIDAQETADRLVGWITKFKEVGDIAVQYDPVHAALPWAGVRFILLVRSTIHYLYVIFTEL